jgi:Tfp pilus assembly protein PilN
MRAVNLIPVEQRTGQPVGAGRSQGGAYAVLVLIGALALMAYLYGSAHRQISSRQAQVATLTAEAQRAQATAERLAPYTSFIAQRQERTQAVESLIDSRFDWAHVFHEFGRVIPYGVAVSTLSGTVGSTTSSTGSSSSAGGPATPAGSIPTFTLGGCASGQPVVALMLQRLRLIDGVKEVTLQSSTSGPRANATTSGTTSTGGCSSSDPVFSVVITFEPLPAASAVTAATKTVSDSASKGASKGAASATTGSTSSSGSTPR